MKNTKYKKELPTLDLEKVLSVDEAVEMVTSQPKRKFVESVDVAVSLGIDPKKSDQNVRGSLTLPVNKKKTNCIKAKPKRKGILKLKMNA